MNFLDDLIEQHEIARSIDLERRSEGYQISGDFTGSVTGYWVKLDQSGAGIVSHKNKEYVTKPIGFVSLSKGTEVELSYANGIYYSKF